MTKGDIMKTVIVTDSTCDLTKEQLSELNVEAIPLSVIFGQESYLDGVNITKAEFFEKLEASSENPTTSQPSPEEFLKVFEKHKAEGNEDVLKDTADKATKLSYIKKILCSISFTYNQER